ncbi:uncharacterized protein PG998_008972 [Apiospora kogelbergensis]|uniref:uncharacterized protein n=1 Tax=Apiospora kogelbergensis TaxID=1337665 RepID=UPI0031308AC5
MEVKDHDDVGHYLLDSSLPRNVSDIEIMLMPTVSVEIEVPGHKVMPVYPTLAQSHGSGRVELASMDALAQPQITYPLFTQEHDIKTARLAVRFAMRLVERIQHSDYPYPVKLLFVSGQGRSALYSLGEVCAP